MPQEVRHARCACGQLGLSVRGDPRAVGACHCEACQRRTGSAIGLAAFFEDAQVVERHGESHRFSRTGESGATLDFSFCPQCGSTVSWTRSSRPGLIVVAVGAFADPSFPGPERVVWAQNRHDWLDGLADLPRVEGQA